MNLQPALTKSHSNANSMAKLIAESEKVLEVNTVTSSSRYGTFKALQIFTDNVRSPNPWGLDTVRFHDGRKAYMIEI